MRRAVGVFCRNRTDAVTFEVPPLDDRLASTLVTPALLVWPNRIDANIAHMIEIAKGKHRLRPHCKTHKMVDVIRKLVATDITHHKAATVVEVDMLCRGGAANIVLAGNLVGPSLAELLRVAARYPDVEFSITADDAEPIRQLSNEASRTGTTIGVMVDLDVGLHRTGVDPDSSSAETLYALVDELSGVRQTGLHIYDGHQHQTNLEERTTAVQDAWKPVERLVSRLEAAGWTIPELLCGGTPSFPVYADMSDPRIRISPGTCTLHDVGYGRLCPDLVFNVAAAVATRVVSSAMPGQLTLDVGHKAICGDPPAGKRVYLPDLPDAEATVHNEEHLTVKSEFADRYSSGDLLMALPVHVCPTVALHHKALAIADGTIRDEWRIARQRNLSDVWLGPEPNPYR